MNKERNICTKHESLECEVKKGKFFRRIFGSKTFLSIFGTTLLFIVSWGIWVTNFIYVKAAEQSSSQTSTQGLSKNLDEVKGEMKEIKTEIKNQTESINKNQQDMLKLLIDIQKEQRRNNGQKTGATVPK